MKNRILTVKTKNGIFKFQANKNFSLCNTDHPLRGEILNKFQGRQLNSKAVINEIKEFIAQ